MGIFGKIVAGIGIALASLFGHPAQAPNAGATVPIVSDFYNDSLQSGINATVTSFTMVRGTSNGVPLSGAYGFTIDQGSPSQENVFCATVAGVNASNCVRGLDLTTGTTSVSALEQVHNRGATVQITTAPVVNILSNIMRGVESIPQSIFYDPSVTIATLNAGTTQAVASVAYVNSVGSTGCANASTGARGCVQLATGAQAASGTSLGSSGAALDLPAAIATSTCQSAANSVLVASSTTGKLDGNCFNANYSYTFNAPDTFTGGVLNTASSTNTATTSLAASNVNGNALRLNTVPYAFPSSQGSANTALTNNGSGTLTWSSPVVPHYSLVSTSGVTSGSGYATSSVALGIPANTLQASSTIQVHANTECDGGTSAVCTFYLRDSITGVTLVSCAVGQAASGANEDGPLDFVVTNNSSISAQSSIYTCTANLVGNTSNRYVFSPGTNTSTLNTANAINLVMVVNNNGASNGTVLNFSILVNP